MKGSILFWLVVVIFGVGAECIFAGLKVEIQASLLN